VKHSKWTRIGFAALLVAACGIGAQAFEPGEIVDQIKSQAVFCEGTYALCIRAPCVAIPTMDRLGNYSIDKALCSCEWRKVGRWGPVPARTAPRFSNMAVPIRISTHSNRFNDTHRTLTCSDPKTSWAWC
jgi:hypothetical protein